MKLKTAFLNAQLGLLISFLVVLISGSIIYFQVIKQFDQAQHIVEFKQEIFKTLQLQNAFTVDRDEQSQNVVKQQFDNYSNAYFDFYKIHRSYPLADQLLTQIHSSLRQFEANLYRQIAIQKKLGYTEDKGLRKRFRNAIHLLQSESKDAADTALELLILELRRREKDYLLRWNEKYLDLHNQLLVQLKVYLQTHLAEKRPILLDRLAEYETSFVQYTSLLAQQGFTSSQGLAGENNQIARAVNERFLNLSLYLNQQQKEQSNHLLFYTFAITVTCLLVALLSAFFINKRIGYGFFKLNDVIKNISDTDDFSKRCRLSGDDEVNTLGNNLNRLLDHTEELINRLSLAQNRLVEDAKMASLGSMVKGFAHELNTPLGIAVTSESHLRDQIAQLKEQLEQGTLKKATLDNVLENVDSCLDLMHSSLTRSAGLIHSFKQVAAHQEYDELVEFNVEDFLSNLCNSLKHELDKYDVNIQINAPQGLVITSYLGAFNQIFTILIINSLRHGVIEGQPLNIEILSKMVSGTLHFRYIDDGVGVDDSLLEKVFEPFVTTKRTKGGTGLGLSIVYNLVTQRLKGEVEFQSVDGNGVCIYLHFEHIDYSLKFDDSYENGSQA